MKDECAFPNCEREQYGQYLCKSHLAQRYAGRPLTPLRQYNKVVDGKKRCTRCKKVKSLDDYTKRPNGHPLATCKPCTAALERAAYHAEKRTVDPESTTITGGTE